MSGWTWDETLYRGSAPHYARGRLAYPPQMIDAIRAALGLDGRGRLLDIGCGPGSLTIPLAPMFEEAVGIDADGAMVAEAARRAPANARFLQLRAEELPGRLGRFRAATLAQSFHWMDQARVARSLHAMLDEDGAVVHVGATTHAGEGNVPHDEIDELVRSYLGPVRRAGQGVLPDGPPRWEDEKFRGAGFSGPERIDVPWDTVHERTEDEVVASVFSRSTAAPHLFGDRFEDFESDLRALLRLAAPDARFQERTRDITLSLWR
jgi:SAM-dependent methyltransferase